MNKKLLAIAVAGALSAPLAANAADVNMYGSLGWKLVDADNASWDMRNTKARLGWSATETTDYGKFIGQLEFDFDNGSNSSSQSGDSDELDVRRARVIWATQGAGTFVFAGRTPSGQYADMYSHTDIFSHGGYHYFAQGDHTGKLVAWKTPVTNGLYAVLALIANNTTASTDDIDVTGFRVVWNSGPWHAGGGVVIANNSTASDDTRESIGVSWKNNGLMVGATWEDGIGSGSTDGDQVLGVAASFTAGNNTFKAGFYDLSCDGAGGACVDSTNHSGNMDGDSGIALEVAHAFSKNVTGFVTFDSVENSGTDSDSTAIGLNMSF
ncbi:MAG: hypothetical protein Kow006_04670 [Gammaproteobacteria bacterium]